MKTYIERAAVLKVLEEYYPGADERLHIVKDITSIPAADVAEVRHGRWIDGVCSECGFDAMYYKGIPVSYTHLDVYKRQLWSGTGSHKGALPMRSAVAMALSLSLIHIFYMGCGSPRLPI